MEAHVEIFEDVTVCVEWRHPKATPLEDIGMLARLLRTRYGIVAQRVSMRMKTFHNLASTDQAKEWASIGRLTWKPDDPSLEACRVTTESARLLFRIALGLSLDLMAAGPESIPDGKVILVQEIEHTDDLIRQRCARLTAYIPEFPT